MEWGDMVYGYRIYIITLQWDKKVYSVIRVNVVEIVWRWENLASRLPV